MEKSMLKVKYRSIVVAGLAAFVVSSLYCSPLLLGNVWHAVDPVATAGMTPSIGKAFAEIVRTLVITYVFARLMALLGGED
jgi:hypothetical protein